MVDRYGNDLDGGNGDITYTIKCVKNQANGGTKYAEEFEVSSDSSLTIFDRGPSGEGFPLIVPNDGGGILSKPSFKIGNAENLNPTSLGPWEQPSGDYSNFDLVITPTYRRGKGETNSNQNPVAVRFNDEDILQQVLSKDLTRSIPLLPGLSIYRENDCDRLVSIRVGNKTILDSYDVSTQTNETWAQAVGILDENLFLDNSEPVDKTNKDLFYEIEVHGGTTGEVVFDNAFLLKGTPLNGRWIFMVPGQIAHALDDQFQFTDEAPTTNGKHAQVILDRYGRHVPTVSSSPAVPEP
ncbi:MAG: hypothetical protein P1V97_31805 [Planctomycetota bacterium]|nr:hypothetical protein [Planctomycetota bacterium]